MSDESADKTSFPYGPDRKPWKDTLSDLAVSSEGNLLVSEPTRDPLVEYADVSSHVSGANYQVPSLGLKKDNRMQLKKKVSISCWHKQRMPLAIKTDLSMPEYEKVLSPYLGIMSNNVGDPYTAGTFTINTKVMECNVLDYYASLWNAKWPYKLEDPETYWGYVLTMGSTEGNVTTQTRSDANAIRRKRDLARAPLCARRCSTFSR